MNKLCPDCGVASVPKHKHKCSACRRKRQKENCKKWSTNNRERCRELARLSYKRTKARRQAYNRRKDIVERRKAWCKLSPGKRVTDLKKSAIRREIEYSLPADLAKDLVTDSCFYCGAPPEPFNGIDRVDNAKGYLEGNVVSCCKYCNAGKLDRTREAFETWLIRAASRVRQAPVSS